jgi:c(7)-type cytochrome triheme protein
LKHEAVLTGQAFEFHKENDMKKILLFIVLGGFLLSGVVFASDAQVADEDYDEDEYGPLAPIVWVKPVKSVEFKHKTHTMEAGLDCDSCHDELFQMEAGAAEEAEDFTMASLYEGNYCGACHDGSTAFASNTRCTTCHIGVRGHARLVGGEDKSGH